MDIEDKTEKFLSVMESHKGIIYKVTNAYCHGIEDRKDISQEITAQLWKSFGNYNGQYKYSTWIYRIALNVAISYHRQKNRRQNTFNAATESILDFADTEPANETEENLILLQRFVAELKELDKALMLLYLEEKSHREMAEIIGISETNVATKISRIKTNLKQKFSRIKTQ